MHDTKLEEAFAGKEAVLMNETQSYGGYTATLIGVISGEALSDYPRMDSAVSLSGRTYAVVAIEHSDGSPMPETSQEAYGELDFFASPLIGGCNPVHYNAASMHGNYTEMAENGILYRLVECDNVELFSDCRLYLCVSDGTFYNKDAYLYDKSTGEISRNEEYDGLNALFELHLDESKAEPEQAAEYIASLGIAEKSMSEGILSEERRNAELDDSFAVEAAAGNERGAEAVEYALQFLGSPYVWGGDSLTEGADCSGFTRGVYAHFDVPLPHAAARQREQGGSVDGLENAQPGDLLFYENPSHVAIYIGGGKIVHADPIVGNVCVSEADYEEIAAIRRLLGAE